MDKRLEFQMAKDRCRKRLLKYTRQAFRMLPPVDRPHILDIGCGSGLPALELARLSNSEITAIDINQELLDMLREYSIRAGLSDRIRVLYLSLFDMEFDDESFDIIWSEGSIWITGFEKGLKDWRRLLKPTGYMVIHDEKGDIDEKLRQISRHGYNLLHYFAVDKDTWWSDYFAPLERLANKTRGEYDSAADIPAYVLDAEREIDDFKTYPDKNQSAVFLLRKI